MSARSGSEVEPEAPSMGHDRRGRSGSALVGRGDQRADVPGAARPVLSDDEPVGPLMGGLFGDARLPPETFDSPPPGSAPPAPSARAAARARSRRRRSRAVAERGRYTRVVSARPNRPDIAWDATLRVAASRGRGAGPLAVDIGAGDVRYKLRQSPPQRLLVFAVDVSGSMAHELSAIARGAAAHVLRDAYLARDRVAMVAFRRDRAELIVPPTARVEEVDRGMHALPLGGTTPLASALERVADLADRARARDARLELCIVLISDGRANVGARPGYRAVTDELRNVCRRLGALDAARIVMLDTTEAGKDDRLARDVAGQLGADHLALAALRRRRADPAVALAAAVLR